MYQRVGASAYKVDLSNTLKLMSHLETPQKSFKSVHVAGTNGKGSTSHMLASVLQEAGYKTGLYTSPHLKDFRERIKINGELITEDAVTDFVKNHQSFFEENQLSFFEMTVGLAFDYFRKEGVDIAIIEVGLGGRLDSTNVIQPEVSVITNIGLDHTKFLGNTLEEIAFEKAGIIKPNIPVVIGETLPETKKVFQEIAATNNSRVIFVEEEFDLEMSDAEAAEIFTVQELCQYILNKKYPLTKGEHKEQVFTQIKQILIKAFSIKEQNIKLESRFIEDLGLD